MSSLSNHPCPCCGYQTYMEPVCGSGQICPVCFWEDVPEPPFREVLAQILLFRAQKNFLESGVSDRRYADLVRAPLPEEARTPKWMPVVQFRNEVMKRVHVAFADVSLEDGVSLHQADAIDDYADDDQLRAARLLDPEIRWQDIPGEKISRFCRSMVFLDAKGYRFYLPAFMIHALESFDFETGGIDADGVLFAHSSSMCLMPENEAILDRPQRESLSAFLKFVSLHADEFPKLEALSAFKIGMESWLPDFLK